MISVDEARGRLFGAAHPLDCESVPITEAAGRVLAEPVLALRDQPPFAASAMDGYAVRASDLSNGPLKLVGEAAAGRRYDGLLGASEAVRIFTGAPLPSGADAVLIQEDATVVDGTVSTNEYVEAGAYVRPAALDFSAGAVLLEKNRRLEPRQVALAGAAGHGTVQVSRRPKVAFLATGDELVAPGAQPGPDAIIASTTPALAAMVTDAGAEAIDLGIVPDHQRTIAERAREGFSRADVLVTLGGASVGDHDLVRPALKDIGVSLDFWKVAVKPGKPLMFAPSPLVLGLPGNPVSGIVCTLLFLIPLLEKMQGIADPGPHPITGILGGPLPKNGPRRDHVRARFQDGRLVPFGRQDSSMLAVLSQADALIVRMPGAPQANAGETVTYLAL
ncbi:MAG: gephyrin-like molybdotransferase Glp [Pseudomonadota bacterium]